MPVYEYKCDECGYKFEALRSIKDADKPLSCVVCNGTKTHRMLSTFFAHSGAGSLSSGSSSSGCGGCSGGSCSSCRH